MRRTPFMLLLVCILLATLTGCMNRTSASLAPGADLGKLKAFYVVQLPEDKDGQTYNVIRANLEKRGYTAVTGPEMLTPPHKTDATITYIDRWMWDMSMYMLELTINFRDSTSNFPLATGNSFHSSLSRLSQEEMVDEVLTNIFNAKATP